MQVTHLLIQCRREVVQQEGSGRNWTCVILRASHIDAELTCVCEVRVPILQHKESIMPGDAQDHAPVVVEGAETILQRR